MSLFNLMTHICGDRKSYFFVIVSQKIYEESYKQFTVKP